VEFKRSNNFIVVKSRHQIPYENYSYKRADTGISELVAYFYREDFPVVDNLSFDTGGNKTSCQINIGRTHKKISN
jgi:hypothetical protein